MDTVTFEKAKTLKDFHFYLIKLSDDFYYDSSLNNSWGIAIYDFKNDAFFINSCWIQRDSKDIRAIYSLA